MGTTPNQPLPKGWQDVADSMRALAGGLKAMTNSLGGVAQKVKEVAAAVQSAGLSEERMHIRSVIRNSHWDCNASAWAFRWAGSLYFISGAGWRDGDPWLWVWDQRFGQSWQSAIETHVAAELL